MKHEKTQQLIDQVKQAKQALSDAEKAIESQDWQAAVDNLQGSKMIITAANSTLVEIFNKPEEDDINK
jgi:flagellin-specific chaperone FliS